MIEILACAFLVFGLLGMLKEWHVDATVYGDDLAYDHRSSGIPRDITMTNTYANPGDERGKKSGVPKHPVGIGALDLFFFRWLQHQ